MSGSDRDTQIARIAEVLRTEEVAYAIHAYGHTVEAQAAALYDAGLRAASSTAEKADCVLHDHTGPCIPASE